MAACAPLWLGCGAGEGSRAGPAEADPVPHLSPIQPELLAEDTFTAPSPPEAATGEVRLNFDCPADRGEAVWARGADSNQLWLEADSAEAGGSDVGLLYKWTLLDAPPGSRPWIMGGEQAATTYLVPWLAGDYSFGLTVTTRDGLNSASQTCSFTTAPANRLLIEAAWGEAPAQFALHLVAEGELMEAGADFSYYCRDVSWAEEEERMDIKWGIYPFSELQVMRLHAFGPRPYRLYLIQDFQEYEGDWEVLVRIWLDGELLSEQTGSPELGQAWEVGTFDGSAALWIPTDGYLTPPEGDCR